LTDDILAVIKELRRLQKIKARNSSRDNYKRKRIETGRRKPGEIPCSRKIDAKSGEIHLKSEENLPPKYQDVLA
jgi:1-deoxy-D-xylulose-5-phosphate synthase